MGQYHPFQMGVSHPKSVYISPEKGGVGLESVSNVASDSP